MSILYYDCFAGISGDMNLAAMIDLGVDADYLKGELSKLPVSGYTLTVTKDQRHGISGTKVEVELDREETRSHRNLSDIELIIDKSSLKESIRETSKMIFRRLAEAEAKVHNKKIEDIHFHEVGAVDAIVDIVGAAICYDYLKPDRVMASSIELGGGFARCSHGNFPVPAPATVEILKGIPVRKGSAMFETTTPTGAAIISTLAEEFRDQASLQIGRIGYGIGHKESDELPNVLRVFLGERTEEMGIFAEMLHECNIDDMNPEWYDHLMDELFRAGAKEVFFTPVIMKKNRPAVKVSVLASPDLSDTIKSILYTNTTTLGIRSYSVKKDALERKFIPVDTDWGTVTIKASYYRGKLLHIKPEYEECRRIASEFGLPLQDVYDAINTIIERSGIIK
jgi:uncharacterized protein (TIGR00299 family) protein